MRWLNKVMSFDLKGTDEKIVNCLLLELVTSLDLQ